MSKHETWRTRLFWEETGGLLIEEYLAVKKDKKSSKRLIDGLIVLNQPTEIFNGNTYDLEGKDVIVIQTKGSKLGMYLLGQSFFSRLLIEKYNPKSIRTISICSESDEVLEELAIKNNIEVIVINESKKIKK